MAIAGGQLDKPIKSDANDEIGRLTSAFDAMRLSLKRGGEELESERRLLHAMMDRDAGTGLATLCLGGGNAVALSVERI